jgi:hypothetical protein
VASPRAWLRFMGGNGLGEHRGVAEVVTSRAMTQGLATKYELGLHVTTTCDYRDAVRPVEIALAEDRLRTPHRVTHVIALAAGVLGCTSASTYGRPCPWPCPWPRPWPCVATGPVGVGVAVVVGVGVPRIPAQ